MSTLLIAYDLNRSGQNYSDLIAAIKEQGAWWHYLDSTWLVKTSKSHVALRDELRQYIDGNDELLIIDVTSDAAAWSGFNASASDWLKNNL